ncbi:transcriptional regulator [Streptomyces sp. 5-6(2022)]|uniref:MmyB family transcriptional regulator n=1 Tax=Streptomyces sp. 5-6(2022) TaxID=2936510 RepID=UPI0023B997EA|nr:transcriptional regulator [Streptomyces sp. 5-6(2022)]
MSATRPRPAPVTTPARTASTSAAARARFSRGPNPCAGGAVFRHCPSGPGPTGPARSSKWTTTPAMVFSETLDVLAGNRLAVAMHAGFEDPTNIALMTFADPAGATFYTDWHEAALAVVARLRFAQGRRPHDPRLLGLVKRLSAESAYFRQLWDTYEVRGRTYEAKRFQHPVVGALELTYQAFDVRGSDGQQLVVYRAERGSPTEGSLSLLASLSAPYAAAGE